MKRFLATLLLCSLCLASLGAMSTNRLQFQKAGFSIQPLEAQPGRTGHQALMMFLPASDGFAPNVNVQIQPYPGTIDEYATLSRKQLVDANFNLIKETQLDKTSVLLEYSGEVQKRKLHWYAKATSTDKVVYVATATATETQWDTLHKQLKECVHSFAVGKK